MGNNRREFIKTVGFGLGSMGWLAHSQGESEKAERCAENSLAIFREIGDRGYIGWTLRLLGVIASSRGEYGEHKRYTGSVNERVRTRVAPGRLAFRAGCRTGASRSRRS